MAKKQSKFKAQRYLPYEDAREYVQKKSNAKSRKQYYEWHDSVKPPLPKYPHRKYTKEWESWNEFLGTQNSFERTKCEKHDLMINKVRPYWEAVRAVQQYAKEHNLETRDQWFEWYDSGMCPKDIPKYPYHYYQEWQGKGWKTWLGKNLEGKIESAKQEVSVMALCNVPWMPANIVKVVVDKDGLSSMKQKWDNSVMGRPLRVYKWERDLIPYVDRLFKQFAYDKGEKNWLCPNVHALLFELDNLLEFAVPPNQLR